MEKNAVDQKYYALNNNEKWIEEWNTATLAVEDKRKYKTFDPTVFAWVPAYDNYDGTEKFWRNYELSRLTDDEWEALKKKGVLS